MYTIVFKNQAVDPIAKAPINVAVGTVNTTSTSLTLTGKGAANFGKLQQENLLRLLESFADTVAPTNGTVGQLWYDATNSKLKILADTAPDLWKDVGGIQVTDIADPAPTPAALGDLWFERTGSASGFLYVYTGIGRYPTTATTIGGWDQIWPQVETFGGREEYDALRHAVDLVAGESVSTFGSGAIGRAIQNLTNFGALDLDLRAKYLALLPNDTNILLSTALDIEITEQSPSSTLFMFLDSTSSADPHISGLSGGQPSVGAAGSILVNGIVTAVPSGVIATSQFLENTWIMWDQANTLPDTYVAVRFNNGVWEYDNDVTWAAFVPVVGHYIIGTISNYQADNNTVNPLNKVGFMWAHAVPIVGVKIEHLLVEPNSQDWDALLACARYAMNRLELPNSFVQAISKMPFVLDGRPAPASLTALAEADIRYPSASRRSGRKIGAVSQVQNFAETSNALGLGFENRFSLKGINGDNGTNPFFAPTTALAVHCAPPSPGLSNTPPTPVLAVPGTGDVRVKLRFLDMSEMNRFLGSGGGIQLEVTHVGGVSAGDNDFRSLLTLVGTMRVTADKTRIFGQSLPLTISRATSNVGLWNASYEADEPTGQILTTQYLIEPSTGPSITVKAFKVSNEQIDLQISFAILSALTGTTNVTLKTIKDTETYLPGPVPVYGAGPSAFVNADVVNAL